MAMIVSPAVVFRPITRDVFEDGKPIYGKIEAFGSDFDRFDGIVLCEYDLEKHGYTQCRFVHPHLFNIHRHANLSSNIELRLEADGEIKVRRWEFGTTKVHDEVMLSALPVAVEYVTAATIQYFLEKMKHAIVCDRDENCTGAKRRRLDPSRAVLVELRTEMGGSKEHILCRHCFNKLREEVKPYMIEFYLDGGSILPHAPVPIIAGGCSLNRK